VRWSSTKERRCRSATGCVMAMAGSCRSVLPSLALPTPRGHRTREFCGAATRSLTALRNARLQLCCGGVSLPAFLCDWGSPAISAALYLLRRSPGDRHPRRTPQLCGVRRWAAAGRRESSLTRRRDILCLSSVPTAVVLHPAWR
jgi:hypothetical protein